MKDLRELSAALGELKTLDGSKAYYDWAADPRTAKYLTLAADLLRPPPMSAAQLSSEQLVLNALVRRELLESFVDLVFRLGTMELSGDEKAPEPDYGSDDELSRVREEIRQLTQQAAARINKLEQPAPAPAQTPKRRKKTTNE